ncbi:hypothetical protein SCALM49S_05293 [Streptomyces californicus]
MYAVATCPWYRLICSGDRSPSFPIASVAVPTTADSVAAPARMPEAVPTSRSNALASPKAMPRTQTSSIRQSAKKRRLRRLRLAKNCGPAR